MKRNGYMDKPAAPSTRKRRAKRAPDKLLVSYTIAADLPPEYTETYDIAVGGMAMLTNAIIMPDREIIIVLELRGTTNGTLRLTGNVRWSTYDPLLEKYRTGVSFTDASGDLEHELLRYIDTLQSIRDLEAH
jgi:c-di-GMP-binding flagellar brake protein YcgR